MKNTHPMITATTSRPVSPSSPTESSDPVVRLRLNKPPHWDWELTTTADKLPVVQLLDKDGRLLVETTGRTAQRARGSFREGMKTYEKFPVVDETSKEKVSPQTPLGNRNIDGFSSKFGPSEFGFLPKKSRSAASVSFKEKKKGDKKIKKRHSSGVEVALKQLEEEGNNQDKTLNRYSAGDYLRKQIVDGLRSSDTIGKTPEEVAEERCNKVRAYLRGQSEAPRDEKLKELKEYLQASRSVSAGSTRENLSRIKDFLQHKIREKMEEEKLLSSENRLNEIRKRYSDYVQGDRKNYRTRKVRSDANIRFDPEVYERERVKLNKRSSAGDADLRPKPYGRSRSAVVVENPESEDRDKMRKRTFSGSDKRKVYRKTKSDVLLSQMETSVDSEKDFNNPPRRIKSQDNMERSWREYRERKKHERLHKDCDNLAAEEDFMSKPRWKDFQGASCSVRNCRICENMKNVSDPLEEKSHDTEEISQIPKRSMSKESISLEDTREEDLPVNKRPETQLQENYLLLDASTSPTICKVQVNNTRNLDEDVMQINSSDFGYNSMQKNNSKEYKDPCVNSNVKKSDTFKIVDGSENINEDVVTQLLPTRSSSTKAIPKIPSKHSGSNEPLTPQSNEDIARDYFKRVYELLKQRQEDARRVANDGLLPGFDDTSSSNHIEEAQRKRRRRRRKENVCQGDEIVAVGTTQGARDAWNVQRLLVNADPTSARLRRPQLQEDTAGVKRPRHPAPPPPSSSKVNVKDISKYFGSTNKENSPQNGVSKRRPEESTEKSSRGTEMGSNLSRHNGKGLTGRRTQSSGNLCDPKGKLNTMGKILVPCSGGQKERYKFCGSLPNHLDGKDVLDDDPGENNNVISDTMTGDLGGTLPHKKRSLGVHFSDGGPTGTLDLVKHRSQDSLDGDPWRYQQSSDLDLVRCKHGNFDVVRRNQSVDTVDGDSSRKYVRGVSVDERCHRGSDLDLVGTLPKRRQDSRRSGQGFETSLHKKCGVESVDDDMLMKLVHKPDCELMKHRQFNRCVDLGLSKLTGSEPQDQGYASERSPEDEHPPSLPGQPFPSVTPESTFRVTLQKSSRGLGLSVSGGGTAGPVRVKRLFPQQPAALSNKLQSGDILLAANGIPLTGLTNYEALEVLRTTPSTVELVVCRPPGDATITPPGAPPQPPVRREPPPPLRILKPLPPLQIEPCGEFDIEMTKVGGSLGFTLRKADSSALGHYVRALVREPALSDGRIQPGDKIVAVDGAALSPMSHEEAVALLRQCGPRVKLRLYRDLAQTPVSALSPTEPDHPLRPPRTSLRQEAVDMLCDLAVRKLSPGTSNGSSCRQSPGASCSSPRRLRRPATRTPTTENDQGTSQKYYVTQMSTTSQADTSDSDQCSIKTQITNSQPNTPDTDIINPPPLYDVYDTTDSKPPRPNFLDLSAPQGKPHFQFSIDSDSDYTGPIIITESDSNLATDCDYDEDLPQEMPGLSCEEQDNNPPSEPASMPPILSSTSTSTGNAFSYKNPAYQSANPACGSSDSVGKNKAAHSSDQDIPGKVLGVDNPGGSKGLLKWKGVMFTPNDGADEVEKFDDEGGKASAISPVMDSAHEQENQVFMVELTRGWNSRLGFSLQSEGENTVISVVHADSVAAKDGRLRQGDVLLMVNDESVEHMSTAEIIDLLRKIRGSIGITVMRKSKSEGKT